MSTIPKLVVVGVLAAANGVTQTNSVVPAALDGVEGGSASIIPFGLSSPVRYMCLYDGDQLPWTGPRLINGVRFRADFNGGNLIPLKQYLRCDIDISTSTRLSENASGEFDANHGIDRVRVSSFMQVSLPEQGQIPNAPRPATAAFPFQNPWWYGGSPVAIGPDPSTFVVDLQITSQPSGTYPLDSPFTCDSQIARFGQLGAGCVTGALAEQIAIESSNDIRAGGSVIWTVTKMPPMAAFAVSVSPILAGSWADIRLDPQGQPFIAPALLPLPAPLHPHAPDCWVNVRLDLLQLAGFADSAGTGSVSLPIPSDRSIVGQPLYAQAIVRDVSANRLGHITSEGIQSTICGPLGCARVYRIGDARATSGTVTFGAASVIEVW